MDIDHPILAIIGGTGNEGAGLARRWVAAGYRVIIGSRQADKARAAAEKINLELGSNRVSGMANIDAARSAEVCILTVVYSAHRQALESIKDALAGKILIDATSRVDYRDPRPPAPPSAAEEAQAILGPGAKVAAAFQSVPAKLLGKNPGQLMDADVLVCADDVSIAQKIISLAEAAGMRAYYAGPLANATVVEGLTSVLVSLNRYYKVKDASIRVSGIPPRGSPAA